MKRINLWNPHFGEEEKKELLSVIDSSWLSEGDKTREFESSIANYVGAKYAVSTTSGGVALYLALKTLGVQSKDEVIVPVYQMIALANAVAMIGARPVFVDVYPYDGNMIVDDLEKKITSQTKCIALVHMNGRICNMNQIMELAEKCGLPVLEDACQALGCRFKGKHLGNFSDVGIFSFHPSKIITTGQGGIIVTNSEEIYEKICRLKNYGRFKGKDGLDDFPYWGLNFRFNETQAAIGLAQLRTLPLRLKRVRQIYDLYLEELNEVDLINLPDYDGYVPWLSDIMFHQQNLNIKVNKTLDEKYGIETKLGYKPLNLQPLYKSDQPYPNGEFFYSRILYLPSTPQLSDSDIHYITYCLKQVIS